MPKKSEATLMIDVESVMPWKEYTSDNMPLYTDSKEEKALKSYVDTRAKAMIAARQQVDKDWNTYQAMIDAIYEPYPDERSSSVVPLASALIELYVAESLKIPTEFKFKHRSGSNPTTAKIFEYAWKDDWRNNKRKKEMIDAEYIAWWFGTQIMYTGFEIMKRKQKDMTMWEDWDPIFTEKEFETKNIIMKNIDIRNFWIDNEVIDDISQANDCFYDEWMWYERFQTYENNNWYNNVDKVKPREYSLEFQPFTTKEQRIKQGKFVRVRHYWNVAKDWYVVIANDVVIRATPMTSTIDGKKALPFAVRVLGKKNYSIYWRWLCEAALMFNSEINDLRELLMDAIRRSNSQVLAIWGWLSFNGRTFSYKNEILTFDGDLDRNFKQLSGNPPNQAIFSHMQEIYKSIAIYVGIDIQNIMGQPQQTAFQTEVQREASQKRINVWFANRDMAYERLADLMKDLIIMFYPMKNEKEEYPTVETENEKLIWEWDKMRFTKKKGKHKMQITPEMLRDADIFCDVYTNITAPTINAVDKEQKLQFMNAVSNMIAWYINAKNAWIDIESIIPPKQTLRELAEDFNIETNTDSSSEDVKEAKNKLIDDITKMLPGAQIWSGLAQSETVPVTTQNPPLQTNTTPWTAPQMPSTS